jgi:hypothetical protein
MIRDLTPQQRELAHYMSDLSEEAYCAGWMQGLEYALWEVMLGRRRSYGGLDLTDAQRTRLRELSDACAGWIIFDDDTGETWIPTAKWEQVFSGWKSGK